MERRTVWDENGRKEFEFRWKDGKRVGDWILYHVDGTKYYHVTYKDGTLTGCGGTAEPNAGGSAGFSSGGKIKVSTAVNMVGDLVSEVGGDHLVVINSSLCGGCHRTERTL